MSLYQCQHCGCCENTALAMQPNTPTDLFDWTGIEDRKGLHLCCVCMPTKFSDGIDVEKAGEWHGRFPRTFLPIGQFRTNGVGNLEHAETGRTDFHAFEITPGTTHD